MVSIGAKKNGGAPGKEGYWSRLGKDIVKDKWLYLLLLPGILFFIVFKYIPMVDLRIAFMDYNP